MLDPSFDNEDVRAEYVRWLKLAGPDPYDSQHTVGLHDVLRAHFLVLDFFFSKGEGVGGIGPKSMPGLHSAIYRQFVAFEGNEKWETPIERAATLFFGIIKDHPFHDANKRTALLVLLLSLTKNNRIPQTSQQELEDLAVRVAEGSLSERYRRAKSLLDSTDDAEIRFIADFIKRKSRHIDRTYYSITYNDLNRLLSRFGFRLENPIGNHIDVIKVNVEQKDGVWPFKKTRHVNVRVCQIGFPGWKSQVGKGAVTTVRKSCNLTEEFGYDSKTFYDGADPLPALIFEYAKPLERLAYR